MRLIQFSVLAVIVILVVSCGPVVPYADVTETAAPMAIATAVPSVFPWPDTGEAWITYHQTPYIRSTAYDPAGYLWITSSAGVYRFNFETHELTRFTMEDGLPQNVQAVTVFNGDVWVGTSDASGQVASYNGEKWVVTSVPIAPPCYLNSLIKAQSKLWLLGCDGIYYYDGKQWNQFDQIPDEYKDNNTLSSFYSVAESKDGSLWFQSYSHILQFDGTTWKDHKNLQGFSRMFTTADGTLLFISDAMIISFDGKTFSPLVFPENTFRYPIRQSLPTPEGDLWLQIYDPYADGIKQGYPSFLIHDGQIEQAATILLKDAPDPNIYSPILMTPFGWVFYNNFNNLYLYNDGRWETIQLQADQTNELVGKSVIGFSPEGSLWVMDGNQPRSFDGKEVKSPFEEAPCEYYYSEGYLTSTGSIWAISPYGKYICYLDVDAGKAFDFSLFFDITAGDIAPDDSIWLSSNAGFIANISIDALRRGDYRDIKLIKVGGESLDYALIPDRVDVDAKGSVWVFVKDSGLYRYDGNEWTYFGLSSLQYPYVFEIDTRGTPWVGMCGKLLTNDGEKWTEYSQNCLNPSNMTITAAGVIWFADSCDGAYRFDGQEWTHFEKDDFGGMLVNKILEAPDGAIWFFGSQNWTRYQE